MGEVIPIHSCPECSNGKHQNCTEWAINETTDEVVACGCEGAGHP